MKDVAWVRWGAGSRDGCRPRLGAWPGQADRGEWSAAVGGKTSLPSLLLNRVTARQSALYGTSPAPLGPAAGGCPWA